MVAQSVAPISNAVPMRMGGLIDPMTLSNAQR